MSSRREKAVEHEHSKQDQSQEEQQHDTTIEEKKDKEQEQETTSLWTPVWDDNAEAYYWWNTETNETTWIDPASKDNDQHTAATDLPANASNPLDFLLDRIDKVVKKKLDNGEQVDPADLPGESLRYGSNYYNSCHQQMEAEGEEAAYTATAQFNARTGRFTTAQDATRLNPENLTIENRAKRQMQHYFDVDSYTEQRNQQLATVEDGRVGKKKQLTRKEVEYFKKMKKEKKSKKAREWLMQ